MDLNFSRRKREQAIALEVANELLSATTAKELAPPELLAHHFALVCERLGIMPNDAAVSRILTYALKEVERRGKVLDDLASALSKVPAPTFVDGDHQHSDN
jgi:hypothetical protein